MSAHRTFRVDDGAVDVGEDLELIGDAQVVTVGRRPKEITPSRTCFSEKGLIISCSVAILRIQRSLLIAMRLLYWAGQPEWLLLIGEANTSYYGMLLSVDNGNALHYDSPIRWQVVAELRLIALPKSDRI